MIDYIEQMWALAASGDKQGICFFIAVYALLVLLYSWFYQLRIRRWPAVQGRLLEVSAKRFGATERVVSEQDYHASALYEYAVDGVTYQGKKISPWIIIASHNARFILQKQLDRIQSHSDGTVTIFYNPKKPNKSFLIKPGVVGLSLTFVLALAPAIAYWFVW